MRFSIIILASAVVIASAPRHRAAAEEPAAGARLSQQGAQELFLQQIQPLFKKACLGCHGEGDALESNFDMRTRDALLAGGDLGKALVPGNAEASPLYQAVTWEGDLPMPPQERNRLTAAEVAAIRDWINAGAPWPTAPVVAAAPEKAGAWASKPEDVWAFQPVRQYRVPTDGIDPAKVQSPIDAFLLEKLNERGVDRAPPADRLTLIRRATFDLWGLPPTPAEVDAFVNDPSADAFEQLIERLLASPRYGEQWGRHWLDVVRYSDTSGYSNDFERPNAWRYRDYVIRSFQQDKPYDRFIVEQLAGDELAAEDPENLVATGFLRMGPWEHTGMSVAAVTRQLFLDDATHSTGETFLALTLRCASCHDHKFDPLPTRDYYSLQAVFAPVQFGERPAAFLPAENREGFEQALAQLQQRIDASKARTDSIRDKAKQALADLLAKHGVSKVEDLPEETRPKDNRGGMDKADMERERVERKWQQLFAEEVKRYEPLAFSVANGGLEKKKVSTQDVFVLIGGSLASPGELVRAGILSAVSVPSVADQAGESVIPAADEGRRLALARWVADPSNPLTARVMVNRIWQHHFGKGIVETSNNFGKMGKRPTHPELLDWLAGYFVEHGWSVKQLHRLIMRSAAYQQGAEHPDAERLRELDPENKLLAYYPPRRLTADELRDGILAVAGELSLHAGGPGTFPEINTDVALQPRQIMGTIAPVYHESSTREERHRRTIYTYQIRNLPNPMLEVFNQPNPNASCERRDATTVTPQAFTLMNGQFVHEMALAMANRLSTDVSDPAAQIEQAFRLCFGRDPTADERRACIDHLRTATNHHRLQEPVKRESPTRVVRDHVGELTGAKFEFTEDWSDLPHEPNLQPADVTAEVRALTEVCLVLLNANEFVYVY
ncbi:MAG: PSD1 domain-containing protein [Planctomycetes bacterium]|nr:PSD1 domain-containing protein [Planctomycetota bacterium]